MVQLVLPDGGKGAPPPAPFRFVGALVDTLLGHGHTEEDCGTFTSGNLYRVFEQVRWLVGRPPAR